jgi:hypothetical protein
MSDQSDKAADSEAAPTRDSDDVDTAGIPTDRASDRGSDRAGSDRGLSDFVRRAVSAGVGVASKSKDDIMRAAATEMRTWLERLDVNNEVLKVLSKMVIEVKTEIRFRATEDGKIVPETSNDVKIK